MDFITQTKEVPVVGSYDVVVCGGGPAGLIAAIAAARGGARTALVERYGFLGGMATAGLVAPISVFNYNGRRIVGGIPWEFVERLAGIGGAEEEKPLGNITFSPEKYKLVAQRMLLEAGVTLYFHSYLTGCRTEEGRISHVVIENKNGAEALVARYFIDATGDADLALRAGVPMQPAGTTLQPASLIFMLGGVDTDALPMLRHSRQGVNYHDLAIREALEALREREEVPLFGGPWYCGVLTPGVVLVNMTRTQADMADNREATAAECLLHEHVHLFTELLRRHVPAFRNASLLATATQTGVRETRRIRGFHTLTGEEYLHAVDFPDAVSRGCHPAGSRPVVFGRCGRVGIGARAGFGHGAGAGGRSRGGAVRPLGRRRSGDRCRAAAQDARRIWGQPHGLNLHDGKRRPSRSSGRPPFSVNCAVRYLMRST